MHIRLSLFPLPLLILCLPLGGADLEEWPKLEMSIRVQVTADSRVKSMVESYLRRELRSLKDVTIVDEQHVSDLSVLVCESKIQGGLVRGYALSWLLTERVSSVWVEHLLADHTTPEERDMVRGLTVGTVTVKNHALRLCGTDGLKDACAEVVSTIDSEVFEVTRQTWRRLQKLYPKKEPAPKK